MDGQTHARTLLTSTKALAAQFEHTLLITDAGREARLANMIRYIDCPLPLYSSLVALEQTVEQILPSLLCFVSGWWFHTVPRDTNTKASQRQHLTG